MDLRDRIAKITASTLLIVGGSDRFTGEASKELQRLLPLARIFEIPGGVHLCHMTHPELFVKAALEFLENG